MFFSKLIGLFDRLTNHLTFLNRSSVRFVNIYSNIRSCSINGATNDHPYKPMHSQLEMILIHIEAGFWFNPNSEFGLDGKERQNNYMTCKHKIMMRWQHFSNYFVPIGKNVRKNPQLGIRGVG